MKGSEGKSRLIPNYWQGQSKVPSLSEPVKSVSLFIHLSPVLGMGITILSFPLFADYLIVECSKEKKVAITPN